MDLCCSLLYPSSCGGGGGDFSAAVTVLTVVIFLHSFSDGDFRSVGRRLSESLPRMVSLSPEERELIKMSRKLAAGEGGARPKQLDEEHDQEARDLAGVSAENRAFEESQLMEAKAKSIQRNNELLLADALHQEERIMGELRATQEELVRLQRLLRRGSDDVVSKYKFSVLFCRNRFSITV